MRALVISASLALALAGSAFAADPQPDAADAPTESTPVASDAAPTAPAAPADCSALDGDAKTACESAQPASEQPATEPAATTEKAPSKGKLKRSNTNRLESETEDE